MSLASRPGDEHPSQCLQQWLILIQCTSKVSCQNTTYGLSVSTFATFNFCFNLKSSQIVLFKSVSMHQLHICFWRLERGQSTYVSPRLDTIVLMSIVLVGFSTRFFWGHVAGECQSLPSACHAQTLDLPHPNPWPATPEALDLPRPNPRPATRKPLTCHIQTLDLPHPNLWPATPKPLTSHAQSPWPAARGRSHDMCFFFISFVLVFLVGNIYIFKFQCSIWCGFLCFQVVFLFFWNVVFFELILFSLPFACFYVWFQ